MKRLPVLAFILVSAPALADRRELYVLLEGGAAVESLRDAPSLTQSGTAVGPAGELQAFYGLSNTLHLGGYVRGLYAPNVSFQGVAAVLEDGSRPTGTLYEDTHGFGAGVLARWRFDTGYTLAPLAQLELGATWRRYRLQQLIPSGKDFAISLPDKDELAPDVRLVAGVEYRVLDQVLLELLVGARRPLAGVIAWQLTGSVAVGLVW